MFKIVSRTMLGMSAYACVVTSPATCTWPVVMSVSTATRLRGSCASRASRIPSLIWSAILSGWPSVTDSEVNRRRATVLLRLSTTTSYRGQCSHPVVEKSPGWVAHSTSADLLIQQRGGLVPNHIGHIVFREFAEGGGAAVGPEDGH